MKGPAVLTVNGQRKETNSDKGCRYFAHEMAWGDFSRAFRLPSYIDSEKVAASLQVRGFALSLLTQTRRSYENTPRARTVMLPFSRLTFAISQSSMFGGTPVAPL
ncbi:Hsp20/alpha crystallin family protein [Nitrospira sp. Nam74]